MIRKLIIGILAVGLLPGAASAATVRLSVVAAADPDQSTFTAEPGILVDYEIRAIVEPDDPEAPDTGGLAGFSVDLLTDLGLPQAPASAFGETVQLFLTSAQQLGIPQNDDVIGISAAQLPGASAVTGIGLGVEIVLATGVLMLPNVEETVTVELGPDSTVNVLDAAEEPASFMPDVIIEDGFTITISASDGPAGTDDGSDDGDMTDGDDMAGDGTDGGTDDDGDGTMDGDDTGTDTGDDSEAGDEAMTPFEQLIALFLFFFGPIGVLLGALIALILNVQSGTIP